jgi:CBS domain-containing protein
MKVKDLLAEKGKFVITVKESSTIHEAMETFAKHRVGSLLILDESEKIVGILAARDVLMAVLNDCEAIQTRKVDEIMTKQIIVGTPEDDLDYIQALMTENRIRHVPIIENKALAGILSIGDVVKSQLKHYHVENHYLKEYIEGKYPA